MVFYGKSNKNTKNVLLKILVIFKNFRFFANFSKTYDFLIKNSKMFDFLKLLADDIKNSQFPIFLHNGTHTVKEF